MSRSSSLILAALAGLALQSGCRNVVQQGDDVPMPKPLVVALFPGDGQTGVDSTVTVQATVFVPSRNEDASKLVSDISDSLLVLDSAGVPVSGSEKTISLEGYEGTDNAQLVEFRVRDLGPGWHEIEFESDQEFQILEGTVRPTGGGRYVARFTAESMPRLQAVSVCPRMGSPAVVLEFSEAVRLSTAGDLGSAVKLTGLDPEISYQCEPLAMDENTSFDPTALSHNWFLDCGDVTGVFRVELSDISSAAAALQPPTEVIVDSKVAPIIDDCAKWMVE